MTAAVVMTWFIRPSERAGRDMRPCDRSVAATVRGFEVVDQQFKRVLNDVPLRLSKSLSVALPPEHTRRRAAGEAHAGTRVYLYRVTVSEARARSGACPFRRYRHGIVASQRVCIS